MSTTEQVVHENGQSVEDHLHETLLSPANMDGFTALAPHLAKAAKSMNRIEKRGKNQRHGYEYATSEDVKDAARKALAEQGVHVFTLMTNVTREQEGTSSGGTPKWHINLDINFIVACENGAITIPWHSEAYDYDDKGVNKALVAANKYFLITLLQISTGDEPDADASDTAQTRQSIPDDWFESFMDTALGLQDGYYNHPQHVKNTLKKVGYTGARWELRDEMLASLRAYAIANQNGQSDAEPQTVGEKEAAAMEAEAKE